MSMQETTNDWAWRRADLIFCTLLVCALAVASAVFLIVDMSHPYLGFIHVQMPRCAMPLNAWDGSEILEQCSSPEQSSTSVALGLFVSLSETKIERLDRSVDGPHFSGPSIV